MSLSIYRMIVWGELKETNITLKIPDRSLVCPKGILEDVLVQVRQFIFLVKFIVLDFEEDFEIPILLRRPFLATSRAIIDVGKGEMTIEVNGEVETFKCVESEPKMKKVSPNRELECQAVQVVLKHMTNKMKNLKWCVFEDLESRMQGIQVRK